jgi:hypothetical protein
MARGKIRAADKEARVMMARIGRRRLGWEPVEIIPPSKVDPR